MNKNYLTIKPSPVIIVKKLIIVEILLAVIVTIVASIVDILPFYETLPFSDFISATVLGITAFVVFQVIFLVSFFLGWYFETYEVHPNKLIVNKGLIFKKKAIKPFEVLTSITSTEGLLGRFLNYASIELSDSKSNNVFVIPDVYKSKDEIEKIELLVKVLNSPQAAVMNEALEKVIADGEGKNTEFKESFRWDIERGSVNKDIEHSVLKTVAAFMNTSGGKLIIGVDDNGKVVGLKKDIKSLKKKNHDGFENHFTTAFSDAVGPEFTQYYIMSFENCEDEDVCVVEVTKAAAPAYYKNGGNEKMYVRAGNSTRELNVREGYKYIRTNFKEYNG